MVRNARTMSDGDRIRTRGTNGPELDVRYAGFCSDAELIRTHGINAVKSNANPDRGRGTEAQKIRSAGIGQPASVARLRNDDLGRITVAERIRTDIAG